MADDNASTVLIVDDAPDTVRMLNDVLERAGMRVLVALEGSQALSITQHIVPDVILLDALMPNLDGFETCRRLKQNPVLVDVPIIFMTGLSDTEHVVMGFNAGGVDYITKPIDVNALLARMKVHIANARVVQSTHQALDRAGQYLFSVDGRGEIVWATPRVYQRFHQCGFGRAAELKQLSGELAGWLRHGPQPGYQFTPACAKKDAGSVVEFLASISAEEHLLRVVDNHTSTETVDRLRGHFNLTGREAEVLIWIAYGKTNREIGQILNMSPRTVNKHLEQIFRKLEVDNRTAAAAAAIRYLASN